MADLSAYQSLNVHLNFQTNEIVLTDPDGYPPGVSADLVGKLTITQPDGVRIAGDFTDIVYSSGALQPHSRALRLDSDGNPQQGTYTIEYEIDHPGYTPTTITRTFDLVYTRKTLDLEEDFDVFTPSLFYRDNTNYNQQGFTTNTNTVAWTATIGGVGSTSGSANAFDLVYGSDYYDALYTIGFQRDVTYTHQTYSWLTLTDRYEETINTTADTPPTVNDIIECINDLKTELDAAAGNCTRVDTLEEKYQKAVVRYDHLIHKLRVGDTADAEDLLEEVLNLTSCTHTVYRDTPIQPYDLGAYSGSSSVDDFYYYTLSSDLTEVTLAAMNGKVIRSIDMDGVGRLFTAGADGDTPATGQFIVVTGSTPRKFKFGGTMYADQWLKITYREL